VLTGSLPPISVSPSAIIRSCSPSWHSPFSAAAERAGVVLGFHIGTGGDTVVFRGPGGAVINYMETTYPGMRVVSHLVASGALDRHPDLRILIAEGGAAWVSAIGDRMDEAYRQHGMFVRPELSRLPSEIICQQVYASFQHDKSAVQVVPATGYRNVLSARRAELGVLYFCRRTGPLLQYADGASGP